jgi:flavin reductase (DIM6/NTAB) family NADH-FMN oxidoreductase RutF
LGKELKAPGEKEMAMTTSTEETGFHTISPKILYFGNSIALVSSANEDASANLAPIPSFWALGWTMVLGLLNDTKTLQNLRERGECVINLPSPELWRNVELLAPLTGLDPVPSEKAAKFRHERDKFAATHFTPLDSERVSVPRVKECPAQLEAITRKIHSLEGEGRLKELTGDGSILQERVHVVIETKVGAGVDVDQLTRHCENFDKGRKGNYLMPLTKDKTQEHVLDLVQHKAKEIGAVFRNVTFENLCESLKELAKEHETHLVRVIEDYAAYCADMNLPPDRRKWLRIVPWGVAPPSGFICRRLNRR